MTISEAERLKRQRAVTWAEANLSAAGVVVNVADQAHNQRFIDGEIDLGEYVFLRKPFAHSGPNSTEQKRRIDRANFLDDLMSELRK